jgi:hypothetical protein
MVTFLLARCPKLAPVLLALLFVLGFEAAAYAVSVSDVIEMLKYTYLGDRVAYLASLEVVAWNILKRKQLDVGGRGQMLLPIRTKNAGIWRGITEAGVLPTDRAQADTQEASYSLQEFYGAINVSWRLIQDARNDRFAFERAVDFIDNAFRARMLRLINMDLLGNGKGELGTLPAADDQTVVTVASMPGADIGMLVDLMDLSNDNSTLGVANEAVVAVDPIINTFTMTSAAAGTAAGDYFTVAGSVRTATGSLHMLGLLAWVSDANPSTVVGFPGGINRSTLGNDFWKASVLSNAGVNRPLTEDLLLQASDAVRKRGGKPINKWLSNLNIVRRYHELLKEDTFFAYGSGPKALESGVGIGRDESGMKQGENSDGQTIYRFSGTQWHVDPFFQANKLIGLNTEHFWIGHGENEVPQVLSEVFDGQVPYFTKTANAYFDIEYYWQGELICDAPTASVLVSDLAES